MKIGLELLGKPITSVANQPNKQTTNVLDHIAPWRTGNEQLDAMT